MNSGVYLGMDRAQYDALTLYNQSTIKKWLDLGDLPSEFKYWQDHRDDEQESDSLRLGRALDCTVLDTEHYDEQFITAPKCDRRTKIGKETWEEFKEVAGLKTILSTDEAWAVNEMALSLEEYESLTDVFLNCKKAVLVANIFGFDCKGEIDLWEEKSEHIWDVKALRDVSPKEFSKAFFNFGYHIQACFYLTLARALKFDKQVFNFVCVKNDSPYTVKVHSFAPFDNPDHQIIFDATVRQINDALGELDRRIKADDFADDQDWRLIDIPSWKLKQANFLEMA